MPIDQIIDAATYAERLEKHRAALAQAKRDEEAAATAVEMGSGDEQPLRAASAAVRDIEARIQALHRWRQRSKIVEAEVEERQAAADRLIAIAAVHTKREEIAAEARVIQSKFDEFVSQFPGYTRLLAELEEMLLPLVSESKQRSVRDALWHRHEGALLVGRMQAAEVPGLHHLIDMDPIEAMRAYEGKSLPSMVDSRLDYIMHLAAPDLRTDEPETEEAEAA